jgi:hypothetical protein
MDYKIYFVPRRKEKGYAIDANIQIDAQTDEYFDRLYDEH